MHYMGLLLCASSALAVAATPPNDSDSKNWERSIAILEYVAADAPEALAENDEEELKEQTDLLEELSKILEDIGPKAEREKKVAKEILALAVKRNPSFPKQAAELAQRISNTYEVFRIPNTTLNLTRAAKNFSIHCASCHGAQGAGDGPASKGLSPAPSNFRDAERMQHFTPRRGYSAVSFGISGTAMRAFPELSDIERWELAFHIAALRHPACTSKRAPGIPLDVLARSSDNDLAGKGDIACLRRSLPKGKHTTAIALEHLDKALTLFRAGDARGANRAVVDAYLEGVEPQEPMLRSRDEQLVRDIEAGFARLRLAGQGKGSFEEEHQNLLTLLERADTESKPQGGFAVFFAAFIILLREGFESVVIVGCLLAVLKKLGASQQRHIVHAGWILSLLLGAGAFVFGQVLFAGARREWMEAIVALAAVLLLLYATVWLNARAQVSSHFHELRQKMGDALQTGSTASLFLISFSAVGRESIETALFLQSLAGDDPRMVVFGALSGLALLVFLIVVIRKVGISLPMRRLFLLSSALLLATAVMLLGKGLRGLQELGVLPLHPIPGFTLDALGVFPDLLTLVPQLILFALCAYWMVTMFKVRKTAATP